VALEQQIEKGKEKIADENAAIDGIDKAVASLRDIANQLRKSGVPGQALAADMLDGQSAQLQQEELRELWRVLGKQEALKKAQGASTDTSEHAVHAWIDQLIKQEEQQAADHAALAAAALARASLAGDPNADFEIAADEFVEAAKLTQKCRGKEEIKWLFTPAPSGSTGD
jgi:hypothetical protein